MSMAAAGCAPMKVSVMAPVTDADRLINAKPILMAAQAEYDSAPDLIISTGAKPLFMQAVAAYNAAMELSRTYQQAVALDVHVGRARRRLHEAVLLVERTLSDFNQINTFPWRTLLPAEPAKPAPLEGVAPNRPVPPSGR